jgi:two-component system OmpR family response regulator
VTASLRILLVDDDADIAAMVTERMTVEGHEVATVRDGPTGLAAAASGQWDVLVLDRLLPGLDGISLARALRAQGVATPILFLTGLADAEDRIDGLNAGGDDYLGKPFVFGELIARVRALARRRPATSIKAADIEIDLLARNATCGGQRLELREKEFQVLEYLMRHAGEVVGRTALLRDVWHLNFDPGTNIIENTVSRLRTKLEKAGHPNVIQTVRGGGYCICGPIRDCKSSAPMAAKSSMPGRSLVSE